VQAHDLATEAEADAGAVLLGGEEGDEDPVECLLDDARAVVAHFDQGAAASIHAGAEVDVRVGLADSRLHGIAEVQVGVDEGSGKIDHGR